MNLTTFGNSPRSASLKKRPRNRESEAGPACAASGAFLDEDFASKLALLREAVPDRNNFLQERERFPSRIVIRVRGHRRSLKIRQAFTNRPASFEIVSQISGFLSIFSTSPAAFCNYIRSCPPDLSISFNVVAREVDGFVRSVADFGISLLNL